MPSPMRRDTVTSGTRIMLPAYLLFAFLFGLAFLTSDSSRYTDLVAYDVPLAVLGSVKVLGYVFLAVFVGLSIGMLNHWRTFTALVLAYAGLMYILLGIGFAASLDPTITWDTLVPSFSLSPDGSITGALWPFGWAVAHIATLRSLTSDQVGSHRVVPR